MPQKRCKPRYVRKRQRTLLKLTPPTPLPRAAGRLRPRNSCQMAPQTLRFRELRLPQPQPRRAPPAHEQSRMKRCRRRSVRSLPQKPRQPGLRRRPHPQPKTRQTSPLLRPIRRPPRQTLARRPMLLRRHSQTHGTPPTPHRSRPTQPTPQQLLQRLPPRPQARRPHRWPLVKRRFPPPPPKRRQRMHAWPRRELQSRPRRRRLPPPTRGRATPRILVTPPCWRHRPRRPQWMSLRLNRP